MAFRLKHTLGDIMFTPSHLQYFTRLLLLNLSENIVKLAEPSADDHQQFIEENWQHTADSIDQSTSDDAVDAVDDDVSDVKTILNSSFNNNNNIVLSGGQTRTQQQEQQQNMEPPTPPRTPVTTASAALAGVGTTALSSQQAGNLDEPQDNGAIRPAAQATSSSATTLPTLSLAPTAKLMANNNNQQHVFNNNNNGGNEHRAARVGSTSLKRGATKNYKHSDPEEDGAEEYDFDDDEPKSHSTANSPQRKQKRERSRSYHNSSKRRNSDTMLNTPISDFDDDDEDARDNCDGGQRSSSESGDENFSDIGSSFSKRTINMRPKTGSLSNMDGFCANDASFDSISASILMQQRGDGGSLSTSKNAAQDHYFDKSSLVSFRCI